MQQSLRKSEKNKRSITKALYTNVPHYPLCNSLLTDFLLVSNWNAFIGSKNLKLYTHTPHTFIQMCFICILIIITTFICILLLSICSGSNKNCIFSIPFSYGYLLWISFYVSFFRANIQHTELFDTSCVLHPFTLTTIIIIITIHTRKCLRHTKNTFSYNFCGVKEYTRTNNNIHTHTQTQNEVKVKHKKEFSKSVLSRCCSASQKLWILNAKEGNNGCGLWVL